VGLKSLVFHIKNQVFSKFFIVCVVAVVPLYIFYANIHVPALVPEAEYLLERLAAQGYTIANLKGSSAVLGLDSAVRLFMPQYSLFFPLTTPAIILGIVVVVCASFQIAQDLRLKTYNVQAACVGRRKYLATKVLALSGSVMIFYIVSGLLCSVVSILYYATLPLPAELMALYPICVSECLIHVLLLVFFAALFAIVASLLITWSATISLATKSPFFAFPILFFSIIGSFIAVCHLNNVPCMIFDAILGFDSMGLAAIAHGQGYQNMESIVVFALYLCSVWLIFALIERDSTPKTNRNVAHEGEQT
jgi:hypothetical protein